jgi:hypothetical protein
MLDDRVVVTRDVGALRVVEVVVGRVDGATGSRESAPDDRKSSAPI